MGKKNLKLVTLKTRNYCFEIIQTSVASCISRQALSQILLARLKWVYTLRSKKGENQKLFWVHNNVNVLGIAATAT